MRIVEIMYHVDTLRNQLLATILPTVACLTFLTLLLGLMVPKAVRAARQDALNPTNWILLRNAAADRGDTTEAIADYTEAIRRNSSDPVPLFDRARVYDKLGRLDDALADAKMSVSVSTSFANGYELIARLDEQSGHVTDADAAIRRAIAISPPPIPVQYLLLRADIAEAALRPDDAIDAYAQVLRSDGDNADALYGTARILLSRNQQTEALQVLRRYASLKSNSKDVIVTVARLLIQLNRPADALHWLGVHPTSASDARDAEAKSLIMLGRSQEAFALLNADSTESELRDALLGEAAMNLHNCGAAKDAFARAVAHETESGDVMWRNYGIASLCAGDPRTSLSALDRALSIDPTDSVAYRYRADAYRALGDRKRSIADAKMAIGLGQIDADIFMMLGIDEYDSGDRQAGRRDYESGCKRLTTQEEDKRSLCAQQLPRMKVR